MVTMCTLVSYLNVKDLAAVIYLLDDKLKDLDRFDGRSWLYSPDIVTSMFHCETDQF